MEEELLEMIVEMAVNEVMMCILATKCCKWSKKKWKKIKDQVHHQREDRGERIRERLRKPDIFDYAVKISPRKSKTTYI